MSKTQISNVIVPSVFTPYTIEQTLERSLLWKSGILSRDPQIDEGIGADARNGGRTINMPYWQDLTGQSQILSDSGALTPKRNGASQDVACVHYRGDAWSTNDLAGELAGDDPMKAIADKVADYWAKDMQLTLTYLLKGLFAASGALNSTHVNDVSIEDGDAAAADNLFSDDAFLDTAYLLGDRQDEFKTMVVHSVIAKKMQKLDLIDYIQPSNSAVQIPTYRGRLVVVDDATLVVDGTTSGHRYYSFVFGPGALGYGEKAPKHATETDRDILAGDDVLVNRKHFVLHPRGVKWVGSPAGVSPTNAELATVANWTKVYQDKAIRIAALVTNG